MKTFKQTIIFIALIALPFLFIKSVSSAYRGLYCEPPAGFSGEYGDEGESTIVSSYDGHMLDPYGNYRILNLFINIRYDLNRSLDTSRFFSRIDWGDPTFEGVVPIDSTTQIPDYLLNLLDTTWNASPLTGAQTRLYHESSFGNLHLIGDFVVVNVNHSTIVGSNMPYTTGFVLHKMMQSVLQIINNSGGLQTLYGRNSIEDYDLDDDSKIDILQVFARNSTPHFGGLGYGTGTAFQSNYQIKMGDTLRHIPLTTAQGVGPYDFTTNLNNVYVHEFSHLLFGGNNFHTSGGHSWVGGGRMTYLGIQAGYGLMGGASSGLSSCNGFDRYRLGWRPTGADSTIMASGIISDVSMSDGNKTFVLRDFVTTGDVVRIKLPYNQPPESNQYIWLENHKLIASSDFLQFSDIDCRPDGMKGIYAYYQVGKDVLFGKSSLVYPSNETDNLRMICANGNFDQLYLGKQAGNCITTSPLPHFMESCPNPFFGYNDLTAHFIDPPDADTLIPSLHAYFPNRKTYTYHDTIFVDYLPYLMSDINPFTGHVILTNSTNPPTTNVPTYYNEPRRRIVGGISMIVIHPNAFENDLRNRRRIDLNGLKIELTPLTNDDDDYYDYQVNISWNHFDMEHDSRWTGNIVLRDELAVKSGVTLHLDQGNTPTTIYRNPVSEVFAAPTLMECMPGSEMWQHVGSEVIVSNNSTLLLMQGSRYVIDGGILRIKEGGRLEIESCALIHLVNGAELIVEHDGIICIQPGAIFSYDSMQNFQFEPGFSTGGCLEFTWETFEEIVFAPPPTYVINTATTWGGQTYHLRRNLIIGQGGVLNLQGCTLRFGPNRKIVVQRGGQLIADSTHFTTLCDGKPWGGIEVWGTHSESQFTETTQGKALVRNGSVVENADIALLAGRTLWEHCIYTPPLPAETAGIAFNGGIIIASSSTFLNNRESIKLMPYENKNPQTGSIMNNRSRVVDCYFSSPNSLFSKVTYIHLNGVRGIQTRGNIFLQQVNGDSITGILSLNSSFSVKELCLDQFLPCQNIQPSRFENLHYGIRALGTGSEKTFVVNNARFINNVTGIYTSGNNYFQILRSDFKVKGDQNNWVIVPIEPPIESICQIEAQDAYNHRGGIYVEDACIGYAIEENLFTGSYCPSNQSGLRSIGVTFNNTGPYNNELYNNRFDSLYVATLAMNQNRAAVLRDAGLCIRCNEYTNNMQDIRVTFDDQLYAWGGIAPHQGSGVPEHDAPAGNRFSWANNPENPYSDIHNKGEHITYYFHVYNDLTYRLEPKFFNEEKVTIVPNHGATWEPEQSCPSNLAPPGGGHDKEALRGMITEAESKGDSTQALINMLKDAGDTEALHWEVTMSAPWQSMEVYNKLMAVAPFVSDTVLSSAIEKENVLVDVMIRDVMVANPHSAKSGALMEKLDQRAQQLPGYMLDQILQGQSLVSVYEKLQSGMAYHRQNEAVYHKQLVQLYLNDTIQPDVSADSLVNMLLASNIATKWYQAAFLRHEQGDMAASAGILSSIPATFSLSTEQLAVHNHLVLFLEQKSLMRDQEKSLLLPDSTAVEWLINMMNTATLPASIYARNILIANGIVEHQPYYLLPDDTKSKPAKQKSRQGKSHDELLKLYPNPAREYVIVEFDISHMKPEKGNAILMVSTIEGKAIETLPLKNIRDQFVLPLNGYKPGAYLFKLFYGNSVVDSKRLIVQ